MEDPLAYPYPSFNIKEQVIHEQCRQLIANVAAFMKNEAELFKQTMQIIIPITSYKERVIAATGISEETYSKIVKDPEQVTTVISDSFPTQGVKRKHDNLEAFVKEHVNEVESVSPFHIKEEIMAPEQIVEDFEIETVPIAEPDIQIKDEVTTDLLKEEEICATSETVYVPSFQSEEALSTVNVRETRGVWCDALLKFASMDDDVPKTAAERAGKADGDILPKKSQSVYDREYERFGEWTTKNSVNTVDETVLLGYFQELSSSFSPSSLWTKYSMLKATLLVHRKVDIGNYKRLDAFLKQLSKRYVPKKSKILTRQDVLTFFKEASNDTYLLEKVVLVMGVFGGLRRDELVKLSVDDIDDRGAAVVVKIKKSRTGGSKSFTIVEEDTINALMLYRKYASLRPKGVTERRFFLSCRNGRCTAQPVGKNTIGGIPSKIANYLGYADAKEYTGHCLRRTSAALFEAMQK